MNKFPQIVAYAIHYKGVIFSLLADIGDHRLKTKATHLLCNLKAPC